MGNYIALLLLIVPGFISMDIYEKLNYKTINKDKFEKTIYSLIYSVFITLINYVVLTIFDGKKLTDIKNISAQFSSVSFVIVYILNTILISIYIGYIWSLLNPLFNLFINKTRRYYGKNIIPNSPSVFCEHFNDKQSHLIKIESNGEFMGTGFIDEFNIENDILKEITLIEGSAVPDIVLNTLPVKYTYFDSKYKIIEYDIDSAKPRKIKKGVRDWLKCIGINTGILFTIILVFYLFSFII